MFLGSRGAHSEERNHTSYLNRENLILKSVNCHWRNESKLRDFEVPQEREGKEPGTRGAGRPRQVPCLCGGALLGGCSGPGGAIKLVLGAPGKLLLHQDGRSLPAEEALLGGGRRDSRQVRMSMSPFPPPALQTL